MKHRQIYHTFTGARQDLVRELNSAHSAAFTMAFAFCAMFGAFLAAHTDCPNYVRYLLAIAGIFLFAMSCTCMLKPTLRKRREAAEEERLETDY